MAEGRSPVSSSQKCSVKPMLPISEPARSRPRTRMASWFEVEMAELRSFWRPIFNVPPMIFRIANITSICETYWTCGSGAVKDGAAATTGFSDIEIH